MRDTDTGTVNPKSCTRICDNADFAGRFSHSLDWQSSCLTNLGDWKVTVACSDAKGSEFLTTSNTQGHFFSLSSNFSRPRVGSKGANRRWSMPSMYVSYVTRAPRKLGKGFNTTSPRDSSPTCGNLPEQGIQSLRSLRDIAMQSIVYTLHESCFQFLCTFDWKPGGHAAP
jgi:hypothetical protein